MLIIGESGTGKELVARAIHFHGPRAGRPFVPINCGAITETLLESEMFGHTRGSFTGAVADAKGIFEQAHGGTVLLDEIGETSPALQVKLLRVLEEGEVRPVGASRPSKVDVRIVAATNVNLERGVAEQRFRQDLYYRLSVIVIHVPPLRERRTDIPLLVDQFLDNACGRLGRRVTVTPAAMDLLARHTWLGNVRELENAVERLVLFSRGAVVDVADLPPVMSETPTAPASQPLFADLPPLEEIERRYLVHVLDAVRGQVPESRTALHFHDTRGTGLANVLMALSRGVTTFDASAGGLGGCSFAPGATGNLATEDLVYMLDGLDIRTGVDLGAVVAASRFIESRLDHALPSKVYQAVKRDQAPGRPSRGGLE